MGDPAGIGPEITIRALSLKKLYDQCQPIVIGERRILSQEKRAYDLEPEIRAVDTISDAQFEYGTIDLLDLNNIQIEELRMGETQPMAGKASYEYI